MASFLKYLGKSNTRQAKRGYVHITPKVNEFRWFWNQGHALAHTWDRIKWHYCPKFFVTPGYPCHLELEASAACQMKCPMCAQGKMYEKGLKMGNMDFDLYKKIVDEVAGKVFSIKLSWRGEPSLNPHLFDMVRYAKEKGVKNVAFLTNFERFDRDAIDEFLTAGAEYISISFDGLKETYERIRYPAKFETVVGNVRYMRERRDALGLKKPMIRVQSIYSAIKDDPEAYLRLWTPLADKVNFISDQWRASLNEEDYDLDPEYICSTPWNRMAIGWDGRVLQCKADYGENGRMGDLTEQTVHEIWHGPQFRHLRHLMRNGQRLETTPCKTCSDGARNTTGEMLNVQGRVLPVRINAGRKVEAKDLNGKANRWRKPKKKGHLS